jgi:hypothetical protein|tara:strand:+ start:1170 stop:1415 length:246 start_codon:yes stop_codon:yes gene_type:complete
MKVRKAIKLNNGGTVSGTSEYGRRHDRLRRKGHKLQDEALYETSTEKGDKKYDKKMKRARKKFDKASSIRERKDAKSNIRV